MATSLANEIRLYLKARKRMWLASIIVLMALIGAAMVFAEGSALAPLIYSIF